MVSFSADFSADVHLGIPGAGGGEHGIFELRAGPFGSSDFRVVSFRGTEALSRLFSFDVTVLSAIDPETLLPAVLGQRATLLIDVPGRARRLVQGIVASLTSKGKRVADGENEYVVRVRPKMWLMKRRRNSRIFQAMSVDAIVATLLDDWAIPYRWELFEPKPKREYCVQYEETDYDFVARILADEGIFYFFEPPSGSIDDLTGGLADAAAGIADAAAGLVGGAVASAVEGVEAEMRLVETVVFGDQPLAYPPMPDRGLDFVGEMAEELVAKAASPIAAATPLGPQVASVFRVPAPSLRFADLEHVQSEECVYDFVLARAVRPKSVVLRDYDFRRPNLNLTAKESLSVAGGLVNALLSASVEGAGSSRFSSMPPPSGAAPFSVTAGLRGTMGGVPSALLDPKRFEVYDHHGEYEEHDVNSRHARAELEQLRTRAVVGRGASTCRRLSPGHRFVLDGHVQSWLDQEYVVTSVRHRGVVPELLPHQEGRLQRYDNAFECAPAAVACRPKKPRRAPRQVVESATVVGSGEIFTDEHGRVKVQFHWDRVGNRDEFSSCWIRAVTPWAGVSWGMQFVPRVGMEVLVSFLGGDVDRPVIVGCLYNGTHPPPFHLPQASARSGIRTQSTPASAGYNELSFNDDAGNESIFLRAERDFIEQVSNEHVLRVGADQRIAVAGAQEHFVAEGRSHTVGGSEAHTVRGDRTLTVSGADRQHYVGDMKQVVEGHFMHDVGGARIASRSTYTVSTQGSYQLTVGGSEDDHTTLSTKVFGDAHQYATQTARLIADKSIVLQCGKSKIVLGKDRITIASDTIELLGAKSVTAVGDGPALRLTDKADLAAGNIHLLSKQAYLSLDDEKAKIFGPAVQIATGDDSPDASSDEAKTVPQHFKFKMLDGALKPYANKTYTLVAEGFKVKATTDGDGFVEQDIPKDAVTAEITLWTERYPTGPRVVCTVALGDCPSADEPRGAAVRLRNLGYYQGLPTDKVTPELKDSIGWFQADHGLETSGVLDGKTTAKLTELHP